MAPSGKTENSPEHHAEAILRAAGSSLSNYTLNGTREAILAAVREAMGVWRPIETAPLNVPVWIKAGEMTFIARLMPDASVSEGMASCDQWQAEHEGEHPPCWSGGACWESNEDECMSLQPSAWLPIPPAPGGKACPPHDPA